MKVGLIGCGGMGHIHNMCLKALENSHNVKVIALADGSNDNLEKEGAIWPDAQRFHDGMELIEKSNVDAIHICLPSFLHVKFAVTAMKKGIAVFVEKPVCLTSEDGDLLVKVQEETGAAAMSGQVVRFFKEYRYLKELYDGQIYGKMKSIMMHRICEDVGSTGREWFHDAKKSGSAAMDLHIHDVDFLRYLTGEEPYPAKTYAARFPNGMVNQIITIFDCKEIFASIEGVWDVSTSIPFEAYYRACFEEATVVYQNTSEPSVIVYCKNGEIIHPHLEPGFSSNEDTKEIEASGNEPYYEEIKYFVECVQNKLPIEMASAAEGVKSVNLVLRELKNLE